jgi:energy-coupling factor transport system permease protein
MATSNKQRRPVVLLRPVPGRTPVHGLWAGTKLITVALIGVLLALFPGWISMALVAGLVLVTARLARVPRGALPTVPRWLWTVLLIGAVVAAFAGGEPHFELGPVSFGRPLKALRVPVDDWAVTLALALRAFPMLIQEFRVLFAARRLRPREAELTWRERRRRWSAEIIDLLAAAMTVALRRADEMGDAITARGGSGQISALPSRPTSADAVAMVVVLALCVLSVYGEVSIPLASSA